MFQWKEEAIMMEFHARYERTKLFSIYCCQHHTTLVSKVKIAGVRYRHTCNATEFNVLT